MECRTGIRAACLRYRIEVRPGARDLVAKGQPEPPGRAAAGGVVS